MVTLEYARPGVITRDNVTCVSMRYSTSASSTLEKAVVAVTDFGALPIR